MSQPKKENDNYIYAYYQGLRDGSIAAGQYIHLIYEYLVTGLQEKRFAFDPRRAAKAIAWVEGHCFHTEGPLAPGALKLELWQKAMLSAIFGIVDQSGNRQFREVVLVVARKNGKSLLASALGNYTFSRAEAGTGRHHL